MKNIPGYKDLIDIHSHHREQEEGVFRIVNIFFNGFSSQDLPLAASLGLHPWHISGEDDQEKLKENLKVFAESENICLIGETGLDKLKGPSTDLQEEVFRLHVSVSESLRKPLIIHCVRAYGELMKIHHQLKPVSPWIIHGFDSDPAIAAELVRKGFYISFGERLMRKKDKFREVLRIVPSDRLFAETDDGGTSIEELYLALASQMGIAREELQQMVRTNYLNITSHV